MEFVLCFRFQKLFVFGDVIQARTHAGSHNRDSILVSHEVCTHVATKEPEAMFFNFLFLCFFIKSNSSPSFKLAEHVRSGVFMTIFVALHLIGSHNMTCSVDDYDKSGAFFLLTWGFFIGESTI